jgi:hypothetical protein
LMGIDAGLSVFWRGGVDEVGKRMLIGCHDKCLARIKS